MAGGLLSQFSTSATTVAQGNDRGYNLYPKRRHLLSSFLMGGKPRGSEASSSSSSGSLMAQWLTAWDSGHLM